MSGFYPPGVTGNEFEISGPDYEETEYVECSGESVRLAFVSKDGRDRLAELLGQLNEMADSGVVHETSLPHAVRTLRFALNEVSEKEFDLCPFSGDTTVIGFRALRWWDCPLCGKRHETELSNDDD